MSAEIRPSSAAISRYYPPIEGVYGRRFLRATRSQCTVGDELQQVLTKLLVRNQVQAGTVITGYAAKLSIMKSGRAVGCAPVNCRCNSGHDTKLATEIGLPFPLWGRIRVDKFVHEYPGITKAGFPRPADTFYRWSSRTCLAVKSYLGLGYVQVERHERGKTRNTGVADDLRRFLHRTPKKHGYTRVPHSRAVPQRRAPVASGDR